MQIISIMLVSLLSVEQLSKFKTHVANEVRLNIHVGFPSLYVANVEQEHFSNDTREEKCNFFCQDLLHSFSLFLAHHVFFDQWTHTHILGNTLGITFNEMLLIVFSYK